MDLKLRGKKVLITGASKGIGRASAELFAAEGCDVVLVARTPETLAETAATIRSTCQVGVTEVACDIADSRTVERLATAHPDIDILVNNAGAIPGGTLLEVEETRWRTAWELKVFGYINMCRAFYRIMKQHRSGIIINVVGTAAITHDPEYICGVTGNAALTAFTQSLGSVSSRDGVRVVAVSPGPVSTDRLVTILKKKAQDRNGNADDWTELVKPLPFQRAATPEEVAAAVVFAAGAPSAYTSGSVVVIDGGASARAVAF